jgi:membrane-bound metal-dependent hydrolase YbcI (DUF457 family)
MPLPLGHIAIGMTTYCALVRNPDSATASKIQLWSVIALLSVLPDIDMLWGLILHGNAMAFHRGPTHSILFAIVGGAFYANMSNRFVRLPKLTAPMAGSIIFTHVAADYLFSPSNVSFFWPWQVYWAPGASRLQDVMYVLVARSYRDITIIIGCILIGGLKYGTRRYATFLEGKPKRT